MHSFAGVVAHHGREHEEEGSRERAGRDAGCPGEVVFCAGHFGGVDHVGGEEVPLVVGDFERVEARVEGEAGGEGLGFGGDGEAVPGCFLRCGGGGERRGLVGEWTLRLGVVLELTVGMGCRV